MAGRTRLTTPPGEEPATGIASDPTAERYVGAFQLPREPRVPRRHRRRLVVLAVVVVLAVGGYLAWLLATEGQFQDPALSDLLPGDDATTPEPTASP